MGEISLGLSSSVTSLLQTLQEIYPQLSNSEAEILGEHIIRETTNRLINGERIAFFSIDSNGKKKLSLLGLEIVSKSPLGRRLGR
jgi:hypothetical protein